MKSRFVLYTVIVLIGDIFVKIDSSHDGHHRPPAQATDFGYGPNTAVIIYQGRQYVVDANLLFAKLQNGGGGDGSKGAFVPPNGQEGGGSNGGFVPPNGQGGGGSKGGFVPPNGQFGTSKPLVPGPTPGTLGGKQQRPLLPLPGGWNGQHKPKCTATGNGFLPSPPAGHKTDRNGIINNGRYPAPGNNNWLVQQPAVRPKNQHQSPWLTRPVGQHQYGTWGFQHQVPPRAPPPGYYYNPNVYKQK